MSRTWTFPVLLMVGLRLTSCQRGGCNICFHPPEGVFEVRDSRPISLLDGEVTVDLTDVTIRYVLDDGSAWEVRYEVTDAYSY